MVLEYLVFRDGELIHKLNCLRKRRLKQLVNTSGANAAAEGTVPFLFRIIVLLGVNVLLLGIPLSESEGAIKCLYLLCNYGSVSTRHKLKADSGVAHIVATVCSAFLVLLGIEVITFFLEFCVVKFTQFVLSVIFFEVKLSAELNSLSFVALLFLRLSQVVAAKVNFVSKDSLVVIDPLFRIVVVVVDLKRITVHFMILPFFGVPILSSVSILLRVLHILHDLYTSY